MAGILGAVAVAVIVAVALSGGFGKKNKLPKEEGKKAEKVETSRSPGAGLPESEPEPEPEPEEKMEESVPYPPEDPGKQDRAEGVADKEPAPEEEQPTEEPEPEAAASDSGDEVVTDTIVARVNGVPIDAGDYVERLKKLTKGKVTRSMLKKTVIDRMINDELLAQEIQKLHIRVSDEEIAEAMNMDMGRFNKEKADMAARVKAFTERVAVRKLLQARGLLKDPTQDELKREYERRFGLKLDTVTISVAADADSAARNQARDLAASILKKAKQGTSLRKVVEDKRGPEGRRIIVKPMFVKKGDERHEELWKAGNVLSEKQYGGPVKTRHGYVVLQLARRIEPRQSFLDMKKKLKKSALNMKTAQAKHRVLEDLRMGAKIEYLIEFKKGPSGVPGLRGARILP